MAAVDNLTLSKRSAYSESYAGLIETVLIACHSIGQRPRLIPSEDSRVPVGRSGHGDRAQLLRLRSASPVEGCLRETSNLGTRIASMHLRLRRLRRSRSAHGLGENLDSASTPNYRTCWATTQRSGSLSTKTEPSPASSLLPGWSSFSFLRHRRLPELCPSQRKSCRCLSDKTAAIPGPDFEMNIMLGSDFDMNIQVKFR